MKIDGRAIASQILNEISEEVKTLKRKPCFAIILAGSDSSSQSYIKQKVQKAKEVGIATQIFKFDQTANRKNVLVLIHKLNKSPKYQGIIIQRPTFEQLNTAEILYSISPSKDIDGFLPNSPFDPPIALAVLKIIKTIPSAGKFEHKNVLVVGKGETAGRPIANFLNNQGFHVEIADSKSDLESLIKNSDIVVSAVGKKVITKNFLRKNVTLIGVGIRKDKDGLLKGDYDEKEIKDIVGYYTTTPGGVGPVNVAYLLKNVVKRV